MKYTISGNINGPVENVSSLLIDPAHSTKWQSTLVEQELLSGKSGQNGARTRLVHQQGKRIITMVETVEQNLLPESFSVIYEAKNVWNRVVYDFKRAPNNSTDWRMECEFRCTGFVRVLAFLMPGMFKKSTVKEMNNFKLYAEQLQEQGDLA